MKRIETSKGSFLVKDIPSLDLVYDDKLNDYLLSLKRIKLSEITEEQASDVVDDYCVKYKNPLQCLKGLLESQGIEITNNTYIFKL